MTTGELLQLDVATLVNRLQAAECQLHEANRELEAVKANNVITIDHAGEMTERAYKAEEERDKALKSGDEWCVTAFDRGERIKVLAKEAADANRALEMERAAHRATAARLEKATDALRDIYNLPEQDQSLDALELSGAALDALGCA